jgi:hypothetical protein
MVPAFASKQEVQPMCILWPDTGLRKGQNEKNGDAGHAVSFPLAVPDYIQADWFIAGPKPPIQRSRGRQRRMDAGLRWAIHQAVIVQKACRVILADVILAEILWGGNKAHWPRNWRQRIVQRLKRAVTSTPEEPAVIHHEADRGERECPAKCPLHGTPLRHQHIEVLISTPPETTLEDENHRDEPAYTDTFLGALEVFGENDYPDRTYHWAVRGFTKPEGDEPADLKEEREANERQLRRIRRLRNKGRLTAIYFPLKLFGASPRMGLSLQQRLLHQAITRELTRGQKKSGRPDKAEVVTGGGTANSGVVPCPALEKGGRYVGFNGNGGKRKRHLHGRGYKPFVWMRKAAYLLPEDVQALSKQVRGFLGDLECLAEMFSLVVAAWHPRECNWLFLADLSRLTKNEAGQAWLRGCLLRVYTTEDFLVRWRELFARKMGFSIIPDTNREQGVQPTVPTLSRLELQAYLNQKGMSADDLAQQLGVSKTLVSLHLSGNRDWTASWQNRVSQWFARMERKVEV